jgi:hypothetical protein
MKLLKTIFQKPSPASMAQAELEEAQRSLLAAQTAKDYATNMVLYHETRIHRLNKFLDAQRKA